MCVLLTASTPPSASRKTPQSTAEAGSNAANLANGDGLGTLVSALNRLADVLEGQFAGGLGGEQKPLYKAAPRSDGNLVEEPAMANQLGIPVRTLSKYRRQGRLPGCWIRNGKRILWRARETVALWERGIS